MRRAKKRYIKITMNRALPTAGVWSGPPNTFRRAQKIIVLQDKLFRSLSIVVMESDRVKLNESGKQVND